MRIDILNEIDGLTFEEAWWQTAEEAPIDDELTARYISSDLLIVNKLAAGRPQDLLDVAKLRHAANLKK